MSAFAQEAPLTDCDTYAASDQDPQRVTAGISVDKLNPTLAIPACEAALRQYPNNNRLAYQLSRAYQKAENFEAALPLTRKAAAQGYAAAQYNLGAMYANGQGVQQDWAQAIAWYRKAADQGSAPAEHNLGVSYQNGQGVSRDYAQAAAWYRKAAEQGLAVAQANLGVMYATGEGVPQDDAQAIVWFRKAAEQGNAEGQHNLSVMSSKGWEKAGPANTQPAAGPATAQTAQDPSEWLGVPSSTMRLKNAWIYHATVMERLSRVGNRRYFKCDYTARTCQRGYYFGVVLFTLLDGNDQKTVLGHFLCNPEVGWTCTNFDTGERTSPMPGGVKMISEDMPNECASGWNSEGRLPLICERWINAYLGVERAPMRGDWSVGLNAYGEPRPVVGSKGKVAFNVVRCKDKDAPLINCSTMDSADEMVTVDAIENSKEGEAKACVRASNQAQCYWVNESNVEPLRR